MRGGGLTPVVVYLQGETLEMIGTEGSVLSAPCCDLRVKRSKMGTLTLSASSSSYDLVARPGNSRTKPSELQAPALRDLNIRGNGGQVPERIVLTNIDRAGNRSGGQAVQDLLVGSDLQKWEQELVRRGAASA